MFGVGGVGDRRQEVFVTRGPTDVPGRAGSLAVHTGGVARLGILWKDLLDVDLMLPVVAEVVAIHERGAGARQRAESGLSSVDGRRVEVVVLVVVEAVAGVADLELIQM